MRLIWYAVMMAAGLLAETRAEYRGFWVDTFNTRLGTHEDVEAVVERARSARANALFVQVRRRGDAWYVNSLEPLPDFVEIAPGFDPLYDLIQVAHGAGMEVHAFVILGAIWNKNPTFAPTATLGPPLAAEHAFRRHGGFDGATGRIEAGADNWLTRSLVADGTGGVTFQGHRFGAEFWLDFGHPDAAAYTVEVVSHLVKNYPVDGLHLDRIRYPEFTGPGQTASTGASVGYNAVSVWRFQEHYGIPHDEAPPAAGDERWAQWRRDQVTNVVRRIYLNAMAIRPRLVVSAALITYGGGPLTESGWRSAEAYWRVYQDWRAWLEEGIIDVAMPMNYKRENVAQQARWFDEWNEWTRGHVYGRTAVTGLGAYLNGIEGTVRQTRRALETTPAGVCFYALANPDGAVDGEPARGMGAFAAAMTGGDGPFREEARVPELAWKTAPEKGHLMGYARRGDGAPLDTAAVYVFDGAGQLVRTGAADGGGFFGAVDLAPGEYTVIVEKGMERQISAGVLVKAGEVGLVSFP